MITEFKLFESLDIYFEGIKSKVDKEGIDYIIKHGDDENTLLIEVINDGLHNGQKNYLEIVKWLLDNGADVNNGGFSKDLGDFNPLGNATFHNNEKLFDLLMEYKPDLYKFGVVNETALESATIARIERDNIDTNNLNMSIIKKLVNANSPLYFYDGSSNKKSLDYSLFEYLNDEQIDEINSDCKSMNLDTYLLDINLKKYKI